MSENVIIDVKDAIIINKSLFNRYKEAYDLLQKISEKSCNTCAICDNCVHCPDWGLTVRYNCLSWKGEK